MLFVRPFFFIFCRFAKVFFFFHVYVRDELVIYLSPPLKTTYPPPPPPLTSTHNHSRRRRRWCRRRRGGGGGGDDERFSPRPPRAGVGIGAASLLQRLLALLHHWALTQG